VLRRVSDYDVVSLIASNAIPSLPETYPIADDSAIEALVRTAADAAKDSDLIFVYISTHGTSRMRKKSIDRRFAATHRLGHVRKPLI